jgi:hypothetical protein
MNVTQTPVAEITTTAIRVLCREIGPVNTARFLNQFSTGSGDYTAERDAVLGNPTVEELLAELKETRPKGKPSRKPRRKKRRS